MIGLADQLAAANKKPVRIRDRAPSTAEQNEAAKLRMRKLRAKRKKEQQP